MAISVRKAFFTVFSQKYNKLNMIVYFVIFMAIGLFGVYFMPQSNYTSPQIPQFDLTAIIALILCFIFALIATGIYDVAINNGYNKVDGVIPDVLENFGKILSVGIKHIFGFFISTMIIVLISLIPFALSFLSKSFVVPIILYIVLVPFLFIEFFGLYLRFLQTLHLKTFLEFRLAFNFITKKGHKKSFCIWFIKSMFLYILAGTINFMIGLALMVIIGLLMPAATQEMMSILTVIGYVIGAIIGLFIIDLTIQFLCEIDAPEEETYDDYEEVEDAEDPEETPEEKEDDSEDGEDYE